MPKQLVSVLVASLALWRCGLVLGQETTSAPRPKVIENPFYRPDSTTESLSDQSVTSPENAQPSYPVTASDARIATGPQTIENPNVAPKTEPWRPPSPDNPFSMSDGTRPLLRPLRWGPANRWRRPDPPAATPVQVFAPRELRPVEPALELQPLDDPVVLQPTDSIGPAPAARREPSAPHQEILRLPEAVAAVPTSGEPPDPNSFPDAHIRQPTWLDAVNEEPEELVAASDPLVEEVAESPAEGLAEEAVPEEAIIAQPNERPDVYWIVPRNDTYDPFDDDLAVEVDHETLTANPDSAPRDEPADEETHVEGPVLGSAGGMEDAGKDLGPAHESGLRTLPDEPADVTTIDATGGPISLDLEPQLRDAASPLAQAQEVAKIADSRDELSRVIHLARQVLTSDAAAPDLQKARELAAWAHNRRGELLDESGDSQAALDDFQAAVRLDGKCWLALHNRAIALAERHQYDQALEDFSAVIELNPGWTMAYRNRGELLASLGRSQEACEDYSLALAQQPASAELYALRGDAWLRMREYSRALNDFTTSIRLNPDNPHALTGRGSLFGEVGQYEQAVANYRHALRADPTYVEALRALAWLLATCPDQAQQSGEEALAAAQRAARFAAPNDPFILEALAAACARLGRFDHAVQYQRRAVTAAPTELAKTAQYRLDLYLQGQPYMSGRPQVMQASFSQ